MLQKAPELLEEVQKPDLLDLEVNANHEAVGLRTKINILLDTFERQKLARPKMIAEYRQAAMNDKSPEGLQGFYHWILEKWQDSMQRLNVFRAEFDRAIREGIAAKHDREFLMSHLILTDKWDFAGETEKIADMLKEKLKRMKEDREEYDRFRHHRLVQNTGFLKVDENTKLSVPDEKVFLSLTVPQRRELLKKLREAQPAAERYAEKVGKEETPDLDKKYNDLLVEARYQKKIIGKITFDKFTDGFSKIDRKEKAEWISGFKAEMERYETLWGQIRGTFKGEYLEHMERQRNKMGHTQLFVEFGRVCRLESGRVVEDYDQALEAFHAARVISVHTKNEFKKDIRSKDLKEQYRYEQELESQMVQYRQLRTGVNQLKNKNARAELDKLYDSPNHGYTQIHQRYLELSGQAEVKPDDRFHQKTQALQGIRRERVRKNVVWGEALFETDEGKQKMVYRLDRMIANREAGRYDQESYAKSADTLRQKRLQKKEQASFTPSERPKGTTETAADESLSIASLRAQNRKMEAKSNEGVELTSKADDAFHMTRVTVGQEDHKVIRFGIGDRRAVKAFLYEEVRLEGRDEIHLMAKEGGIDRMTLEEIRHFRNHLKTSLQAA